jgi:hypothetical protein
VICSGAVNYRKIQVKHLKFCLDDLNRARNKGSKHASAATCYERFAELDISLHQLLLLHLRCLILHIKKKQQQASLTTYRHTLVSIFCVARSMLPAADLVLRARHGHVTN